MNGRKRPKEFVYNILYTPKTGEQVRSATRTYPPIYLYSELVDRMRQKGAASVLYDMAQRNLDSLILIQDPKKPTSGHWTSLSFHPRTREIYFFSSYGGKPDVEKNKWIPRDGLIRSGQALNIFNDGLKAMVKNGWCVHYNQYPYQVVGDRTATCGIWCAAFLNYGRNPDEFNRYVRNNHLDPVAFYLTYFL